MSIEPNKSNAHEEARHHLELAYAHEDKGELDNALRECEMVIRLAPELAEAHNLRGIVLDGLGQKEDAIAAYRKAVQLDPNFREARDNLDEALAERREKGRTQQRLVVIRTYSHPLQANLAKGFLEANDIWAVVADDNVVAINWLYSTAIGGVKLLVRTKDGIAARKLLNEIDQKAKRRVIADGRPRCPHCHSPVTHFEKYKPRLLAWTWLLWKIPLPFILKQKWCCENCGHEWNEQK